ncbi:MAG: ATP-dependent zinc metalloprotease FtsH [Desulfatibacillaceae bacterium]
MTNPNWKTRSDDKDDRSDNGSGGERHGPGQGLPKPPGHDNGSRSQATNIAWAILIGILVMYMFGVFGAEGSEKISYTRFKQLVREDRIKEVVFEGTTIRGAYRPEKSGAGDGGEKSGEDGGGQNEKPEKTPFKTVMPPYADDKLQSLLEDNNVTVKAVSQERGWLATLAIAILPWLLIIGLFVYASRKMQQRMGDGGPMGGGGGPFGFGKSKAKLYSKDMVDIGYEDVAGLENAKKELAEIVDFLKNPERFRDLGGTLPKGIMLKGPPGTGKTLMARATAGEADVPFYSISGSEFIEMFVGVGASRVRDMFKQAKEDAPSIIFIDEIDSIGRVRGTGLGGGHDEREQTLNQILAEMDGFQPHEAVVVIAATNRPDVLDPALVRPGRFDRSITLNLPMKKARKKILGVHSSKLRLGEDVDLEEIARRTVGFSGADLRNLVNEAALYAGRDKEEEVHQRHFDQALEKITMGIEREDHLNERDKRVVAYHEAGHAMAAHFLPRTDPLEKVTIIPRGNALGATEQLPEEDRQNVSRSYLESRIAVMLGGRVSESLVFEDVTSGAANDIRQATRLARKMVCQWGMSDKLGAVFYNQGEEHPFLGREMTQSRDHSEQTARLIDEEIHGLIGRQESRARRVMEENRDKLDSLVEALLESETVDRDELMEILGQPVDGGEGASDQEKPRDEDRGGGEPGPDEDGDVAGNP